ncbi:AGE family epimerase/isomerase [Geomicrobium sp. JCM 19039]|uniref:AGE family epimerase/isomerase n=1 Tax=Geomicrobium sp. JCM 19039 TaxID=1460636 RepID=UPI00045F47DE|nr:AGE family epimerase/isomerase [Geomicrobium sp. JCM 19039]GAK14065.1 N-acylglucosamine 2-epimerase [Geomicrobium sp. JCM 19039]
MEDEQLIKKYKEELIERMLPFWERAVDRDYGGVFTCFVNDQEQLVSKRKYIWSQGRFLWLSCWLLQLKREGSISLSEAWEDYADSTFTFLMEHAFLDNGHAVFAVEQNGTKVDDLMDTSIFADCFLLLGCNAYARLKQDTSIFSDVEVIYTKLLTRIDSGNFQTDPYPIPEGSRSHSVPMILLNVVTEIYETATSLKISKKDHYLSHIQRFIDEILSLIEENRIVEMTSTNPESLLSRHVNPGHTLESTWFIIHGLKYVKEDVRIETLEQLETLCLHALKKGWDTEFGGLLRFVDVDGLEPEGEQYDTHYEWLVAATWDTKLWWPHAEALYTTLLLRNLSGDCIWKDWYEKLESYVFKTFPHPDQSIGEWIQIRNRGGEPLDQVVALPVKDPFHIIRAYILVIQLLEGEMPYAFRGK